MTDAVKTESALLELAARVEAATGPDRELDCAIYNAVPDGPNRKAERLPMEKWGDRFDDGWRTMWADREDKYCEPLKRYSASLDAAMTLVPEGLHLAQFGEARFMTRSPCFSASLEQWVDEHLESRTPFRCHGVATKPALALCAASLRARATMGAGSA